MKDILDPSGRWLVRPRRGGPPPGNLAPIAVNDSLTLPSSSGPVTLAVLTNDVDPEGGPLTLISASAILGTVTVNGDGTLSYTPPAPLPGETQFDTITYEIADPLDARDTGEVAVTLDGVDLQVTVTGENTLAVIADTGPIEITVTEPPEFAGQWSFTVADLATGPVNLVPPRITGTAAAGQVLSASDGLWASDTSAAPVTQSWQWRRGGVDIAGETGASYTVLAGDIGPGLSVSETLSDAFGVRSSASAPTGVAFGPADDPALLGWWDAADAATITEAAGAVSAWADKAGGGALVQDSAARQPVTGTRQINGLNVLDFDGSAHLARAGFAVPATGDVAIHMALSIEGTASQYAAVLAMNAGVDFQLDAASDTAFLGRLFPAGTGAETPLTGGPFSGALILSVVFDRTGAGQAEVFVGDISRGVMSYATLLDPSQVLHVMTNRSANAWISGAVAEVIVTGDVANRAAHHSYLSAKWGVN